MIRLFLGELWAIRLAALEGTLIFFALLGTWLLARHAERRRWQRHPEVCNQVLRDKVKDYRKINRVQKAYIEQLEEENGKLRDRLRGGLSRILQGLTIMGGDHGITTESWFQRETKRLTEEEKKT